MLIKAPFVLKKKQGNIIVEVVCINHRESELAY